MRERDAILRELNRPWKKDALPQAVLTVIGAGAEALIVQDDWLAVADTSVDLRACSLGELAEQLRALGFTVDVTAEEQAVMAAVLLDTVGGASLARWTNPNWRLPDTCGRGLERGRTHVDLALAQLNLLSAGGAWADFWGRYTGTPRRTDEDDATYTDRQLHELLRPRENNYALANLLEEDFPPIRVENVSNTLSRCFQCSDTVMREHPLRGRLFNACTVELVVDGFPTPALVIAARANVAAGIYIYVRGEWALDAMESPAGYDFKATNWMFGKPLPIQINAPPPIGIGKIGPDPP